MKGIILAGGAGSRFDAFAGYSSYRSGGKNCFDVIDCYVSS